MLSVRRIAAIACLLITAAPAVLALGFGRTNNATVLGGTLDFSVAISAGADEPMPIECVSAEVLTGESLVPSGSVRVRIERSGDAGSRLIRVSTSTRMDEPVATVTLTLGCPRSWTRSFVVFVDPAVVVAPPTLASIQLPPPSLAATAVVGPTTAVTPAGRLDVAPSTPQADPPSSALSPAAPISPSASAPQPTALTSAGRDAQTADVSALAPVTRASGAMPASQVPMVSEAVRRESAPAAARPASKAAAQSGVTKARPAMAAASAAAKPTPRLRLDPAEAVASKAEPRPVVATVAAAAVVAPAVVVAPAGSTALAAPAASTPALSSAAAASSAVVSSAESAERQAATEAERLRLMEESLNLLRNDNQATQKTIAGLEVSLRQAEVSRYANPLVLSLAGLVCLLIVAVLLLLWRLSTLRKDPNWWAAGRVDAPSESNSLSSGNADSSFGEVPGAGRAPVATASQRAPAAPAEAAVDDAAWASSNAGSNEVTQPLLPTEREPRREVAVEELIDLEQQADFFLVLGQDDAAIDLLVCHLRESDGASPIPYLKLLEIYRRRDERDAYEQTRERFNQRFNANAPEWDAYSESGRSVEDYPEVLLDIQDAWHRLAGAKTLLETLLFRGGSGGLTFDLSAYGELLLLFSVVRDLTENDDAPDVDLLLPLDGGRPFEQTFVQSMTATMSVEPYTGPAAQLDQTLDLDLSSSLPPIELKRLKLTDRGSEPGA